jgi:hypothetical protein
VLTCSAPTPGPPTPLQQQQQIQTAQADLAALVNNPPAQQAAQMIQSALTSLENLVASYMVSLGGNRNGKGNGWGRRLVESFQARHTSVV